MADRSIADKRDYHGVLDAKKILATMHSTESVVRLRDAAVAPAYPS